MPIAASHGLADVKKRKPKSCKKANGVRLAKTNVYKQVDEIIDQVYCDIANGRTKSEIMIMLKNGSYGNKKLKQRSAIDYYNAAINRFMEEKNEEAEKLRAIYFGRFETLYRDAIEKGDIYNANNILQSVCRIFGLEQKTPSTAIQINSDKENGVTINFGFVDKEEEDGKISDS